MIEQCDRDMQYLKQTNRRVWDGRVAIGKALLTNVHGRDIDFKDWEEEKMLYRTGYVFEMTGLHGSCQKNRV